MRSPALHRADGHFGRRHPLVNHGPSFAIFIRAAAGTPLESTYFLIDGQLGLRRVVVVLHALDAAQHFGKIERLDRDALRFQNFLAVADGVERRGTRANRAHAQVAETIHHAADSREPLQVFGELGRVGALGVQRGDRVRNAVLPQIVAGRHLAAEAVAAERDRHLAGIVRRGLDQHRHVQIGQAQGIGDGPLFAEVRQGHDHAVDAIAIAFEQVGAAPGLFPGFDRSVFAFFRSQRDHVHARRGQHAQHFLAAALRQMIGEKTAVAHDQAHRHFFRRHT